MRKLIRDWLGLTEIEAKIDMNNRAIAKLLTKNKIGIETQEFTPIRMVSVDANGMDNQ